MTHLGQNNLVPWPWE